MAEQRLYLLDQLEDAGMLEIDGLYAWEFALDEALLDKADAAAQADQPFTSEETLLRIDLMDGRDHRKWQFSYNDVMEAEYQQADDSWSIAAGDRQHVLKCQADIAARADNDD